LRDLMCIATPVAGDADHGLTRPARLVAELRSAGVIAADAAVVRQAASRWLPGRAVDRRANAAVLVPTFLIGGPREALWADCFDDWSLAPDVHAYYRVLCAAGYRALAGSRLRPQLLTVNSVYMAEKLAARRPHVVPNGVDPSLAELEHGGDDTPRLIVLGHFFAGRTDFALLETLVANEAFAEVYVGGVEPASAVAERLEPWVRTGKVRLSAWMSPADVAAVSGPATVAAIPHRVCDYTLSQDLMKVYQFLALGLPVICPRLLWPEHLDAEHAFLVDWGVDLDRALAQWVRRPGPTPAWRTDFAAQHSWAQRAQQIASLIG
jgi:hypothetical protein